MQEVIGKILDSISRVQNVRVLLAIESGSRAWGFPSTDSDFDVRFIYVHPPEWYLSLYDQRDVIEYTSEDELLDVNGWELRKALRLMLKGNAAVYEWLQSPVVYSKDEDFLGKLWNEASKCYPLKAGLYHYIGVVKGVLEDLSQDQVKVKRCFYGLRAALSARWIMSNKTVPPMTYGDLKGQLNELPEAHNFFENLMIEKAQSTEDFVIPSPQILRDYLQETVSKAALEFESLPSLGGTKDGIERLFTSIVLGSPR